MSVGDYLSSGAVQATIAAMLRRWTQPRRPAVLLSLTEQVPRAVVLGEDELLAAFQGTPIIDLASGSLDARGSLKVFVFDGHETLGYKIADPRGESGHFPLTWGDASRRQSKRGRPKAPG